MILQALNDYYRRLEADPEQDVAPYGFSRQKISFCVVLEEDGRLAAFQPMVSEVVKGRPLPESRVVPGQSKPPGAGINPCFLWDNATYLLGLVSEGRDAAWARERFEAFRDRHLAVEKGIADPAFPAVCRFLETWDPEQAAVHPELADMTRSFGVFRLRAASEYVHERPAIQAWWKSRQDDTDQEIVGMCLVSGETLPIARLHEPKIKGVAEAQTSGASLISFNLDAFESYGKSQSYNAPVSQAAAFQYATALNHLLADRQRRIQIADATTVFWTESPTPAESIFTAFFGGARSFSARDAEDDSLLTRLRAFLDRLRQGRPDESAAELGDPKTRYYLLGLSPNAARISVRFFLTGTLGELRENLSRHVRRLDIVGLDDHIPGLHELLRETASPKSGYPDDEKIPKPLSSGLAMAILKDQPYPTAFYAALLRRIRSEGFVNPDKRKDWRRAMTVRTAAIKACLMQNHRKELPVSLDPERPEPAYHLGRWFALLEKTQKDALKDLNATIRDKFYASASATPAAVFPRLIQLHQHHLNKMENPAFRTKRAKDIQDVADAIGDFPRRLNPQEQGMFHLGYYHQMKALYTKNDTSASPEISEKESE